MEVSGRLCLTRRKTSVQEDIEGGGQHTPVRIEDLLAAGTSRFRGVAPGIFEKPVILLGDGEGAIRAGQE